jgi:GNAT superfamily N-acetyltransferase
VPPEWRLRPALPEDRDFLLRLHHEAFRESVEALWGWDDADQERIFDEHLARPVERQVIQVGDEDVGELSVEERADEVFLASILVLAAWQGRGIGGSVLDWLLARAAAEGKPLTLRVIVTNPRARRLYERKGFRVTRTTETHVYMRAEP